MAATRSPSPNPTRPSTPNPKILERSNEQRKSGAFNLSKQGNCSEIPQKNSSAKSACILPSPRASFEQKENERDSNLSKLARSRSPAKNTSKGMKSFMAPTISASSKITAASQRKKILAERNEVVQASTKSPSFSVGVRVEEIRSKPEMGIDSEEISCQIWSKSEMGIDSEEISCQNRSRMLDFSGSWGHHQFVPTHTPSSGLDGAPLDVDPSLPSYDPLTNYLSPRPQFLLYKPSPMIEQNQCFAEDSLYMGEGRRLEDSFSVSEGSDDCCGYVEGAQSSPLRKEAEESPSNVITQKPQVSVTHVFEPEPFPDTYKPRIRSFCRPKLIPFLLVLSIVAFCVPVTDSPILSSSTNDQSFAIPHIKSFGALQDMRLRDFLAFANGNLIGLASRMRQWSIDSIAILSSSDSISREEGISQSFNSTLSPSTVHKVNLDFGYYSELELPNKKEVIVEKNYCCGDNMEKESELETVGEALIDMDDVEKITTEFSYENGSGAGDESVLKGGAVNNPKYEEGLSSFTGHPSIVAFATTNIEKVLIELGQEHNQSLDNKENLESSIVTAFETRMMNTKDVLAGEFQHSIFSELETVGEALIDMDDAEKITTEFSYANGNGAEDEIVLKGGADNYPKYEVRLSSVTYHTSIVTTKEKDNSDNTEKATSKEVTVEGYPGRFEITQKLEEKVLIELAQEHNQSQDNIESFESSIVTAIETQVMNTSDDVLVGEVQHSLFSDTNLLFLGILLASMAITSTTLAILFVKTCLASHDKLPKKKTRSVSDTTSCRDANGSNYHNLMGLTEVVGDSGPTEMSYSFNNSISFSQPRTKIGSHDEVTPVHETMQRRDSVSSSVSYGSFTTYEKLSARKGNKDEEMITPVRRSSRIRNQFTSP